MGAGRGLKIIEVAGFLDWKGHRALFSLSCSLSPPDVATDRWGTESAVKSREGVTAGGGGRGIRVRHRGGCANIDSF